MKVAKCSYLHSAIYSLLEDNAWRIVYNFSVCAQLIQYETYKKETRLERSIRLWILLELCMV